MIEADGTKVKVISGEYQSVIDQGGAMAYYTSMFTLRRGQVSVSR